MRWFVEISSLGKKQASASTLCVEATQWQPALQRARALRGDEGPLSNFSIELLDDGYRAIDPSARLKYVVKRAPDDAALTNGEAAAEARSIGSSADKTDPLRGPSKPPPSGAKPVSATSSGDKAPASTKKVEPVVAKKDEPAKKKEETPAPKATPAKKEAAPQPAPQKTAPPRPESVKPPPVEAVAAKPLIAIPDDRPPPPPARPGLPRYTVQSKREEPPTARSPLNYREYVFVVPEGTSEDDASLLVRDLFADVKKSLATIRPGKLVNLAIFDHAYTDKPKRRPLVTLTWKDWRREEPEVRIPSREPGETPTPLASAPVAQIVKPASVAPSPAPIARSPLPVPASPRPVAPSPAPVAAPPAPPPPAPPPPAPVAEVIAEPIVASPVIEITAARVIDVGAADEVEAKVEAPPPREEEEEESDDIDVEVEAPEKPEVLAKTNGAPSEPPISPLPGPKTLIEEPRIELMEEAPPASFPTPSILPPTPSYVPPVPVQPKGAQPSPPPVPASAKKKRLAGDDLLSELFEALSELGFMHDSLAGAEYVLAVALEKIPSEVGLVSFFDINKREFVVARQMGGETSVLGYRQPEKAPLAIEAMRSKHAVIVTETETIANDERWKNIGIDPKCLICAPIALGGRYLGLIEIANPTDEGTYKEGDGNALTYVGQQFGEFVAERGVIIDAEQILESAKASAAVLNARVR